jgi:hypothetical protein
MFIGWPVVLLPGLSHARQPLSVIVGPHSYPRDEEHTMTKLKTQIKATMALGALSLLAGFASHLALTDIYHGEADLSLEWGIVRVCGLVFLVFIGSTLLTLWRALRSVS